MNDDPKKIPSEADSRRAFKILTERYGVPIDLANNLWEIAWLAGQRKGIQESSERAIAAFRTPPFGFGGEG